MMSLPPLCDMAESYTSVMLCFFETFIERGVILAKAARLRLLTIIPKMDVDACVKNLNVTHTHKHHTL